MLTISDNRHLLSDLFKEKKIILQKQSFLLLPFRKSLTLQIQNQIHTHKESRIKQMVERFTCKTLVKQKYKLCYVAFINNNNNNTWPSA